MARTATTSGGTVELDRKLHRYFWPLPFLNFWLLIMWAAAITQIVVFSLFMQQQQQFQVGTPWIMPYGITVGSLTIIYLIWMSVLMAGKNLIPQPIMALSFIFFALYLAGLIGTSIQLFGAGNVSRNCQTYVTGQPVLGQYVNTLAWLEQNSICQSWYSSFAFWIVGLVWWVWLFIMAIIVQGASVDSERQFTDNV